MKTGSTVKRESTGKEDPVYKMGKKRMKNEWTEQDLRQFVESSRPVFQDVSLTQVDEDADRCWQDDGLMVDYELRGGQVDCVLRRCVVADGKVWQLQMTAPLAGNDLPEDRMTPREREMCRDDMNHDFVTGGFNRRYYETEFCTKLDEWTDCHRCAALALVSIDGAEKLSARESDAVMGQLVCFVANQWKKYFDIPGSQIVCRLTGTTFVVGCLDMDGGQLAQQMRNIYAEMPHECITSMGMMKRVPFTLSVAVAGLDELDSAANCWQRLYAICDERLRGIQISGGNKIC